MRWLTDDRRGRHSWNGKVHDMNPAELDGGDGNGIAIGLDESSHRQAAGLRDAAGNRSRPGQRAVGVLITNARIAGGLVEHEGVDASVAVEIAGAEELERGLENSGRAGRCGGEQNESADQQPGPRTRGPESRQG